MISLIAVGRLVMNVFGKLIPIGHVAVLLLALNAPGFVSAASADSFDEPVTKKVVDFGPSPYYGPRQDVRIKLSCFVYPAFMVKQYDGGEKGAEWLAILPIRNGAAAPECTKSHAKGERVIEGNEWSGYFLGVKGSLVFFDADDGIDGGLPFVIYDSRTGKRIFRGSRYEASMWSKKVEDSPFNRLQVSTTPDAQVSLKYLRVVGTECDLHTEKASCWEATRKKFGVKTTQKPACIAYEDVKGWSASAVAYPVEVSLFPTPITKTIDGPVMCWPVD